MTDSDPHFKTKPRIFFHKELPLQQPTGTHKNSFKLYLLMSFAMTIPSSYTAYAGLTPSKGTKRLGTRVLQ